MAVARSIKEYEDGLYKEWTESVNSSLPMLLKKPLLAIPEVIETSTPISRDLSRSGSRADHIMTLPSGILYTM